MYSYIQLQNIINAAVIELGAANRLPSLYHPIDYLMGLGGKRLRPVLTLMSANVFSDTIHESIQPAVGIELFHNFTLIHDDIMDKAPLRRGQPTVHEKWDANTAILSGDVMLIEAYKLMVQVKDSHLRPILDIFNRTAVQVCEGQQLDMNFERLEDVDIQQYLHMIGLKTAVLPGSGMQIGALLGGASAADANYLFDFGKNLGIAFQLQDDYLDVFGKPEKFGKQVGGDIIANKKTALLIYALANADAKDKKELRKLLDAKKIDAGEKIAAVKGIYHKLNVADFVKDKISEYVDESFRCLDKVSAKQERKQLIAETANNLMDREH